MAKFQRRIGGACKLVDPTTGDNVENANLKAVTVKRLKDFTRKLDRMAALWMVLDHNLSALRKQLEYCAAAPPVLRMWRIGSDILPLATHPVAAAFYREPEVQDFITKRLEWLGVFARRNHIRLSFHPGQFVVIGSQNEGVRINSYRELEYHCEVFERMGYDRWHQDGLAVNIHVGLKEPNLPAMLKYIKSAPTSVKNFLTLENDEFSWGAERIVEVFGEHVPLVLDVHHYWIHEHKYLDPKSPFVKDIKATWRGVVPKLHLAMSEEDLCEGAGANTKLILSKLLETTTRAKLRAHSMWPWHARSMDYAAAFEGFDIMWEGKSKNVGAAIIAAYLGLT